MKQFDYKIILENRRKNLKTNFILFIVFAVIYVALFVTGILVSNYENKNVIMIIFSIVLSILACVLVFFYAVGVNENKKAIKTIIDILNGYLFTSIGQITKINDEIITVKNRKIIEITLTQNKDNYIFYYDVDFGPCQLQIGDYLEVKTSSSFLISYEVKDEKDFN